MAWGRDARVQVCSHADRSARTRSSTTRRVEFLRILLENVHYCWEMAILEWFSNTNWILIEACACGCRELAMQLADQFRALGSGMSLTVRAPPRQYTLF